MTYELELKRETPNYLLYKVNSENIIANIYLLKKDFPKKEKINIIIEKEI